MVDALHTADLERNKFLDKNAAESIVRTAAFDSEGNDASLNGVIDDNNSSHDTLLAGVTFTGVPTEILPYSIIFITVFADQVSATDGLLIEQGHTENGIGSIHWDSDDKYTIPASVGKTFSIQPALEYIRVSYTNGGVDQGAFRLHTVLKRGNALPSSHRIQDAIVADDDARLVKSVLTGQTAAGTFVNANVTAEKALSTTDFLFEVARRNISGIKMYSIPGRKDTVSTTVLDDLTEVPATTVLGSPGGVQLEVVSSNAADDGAPVGTGVRTLEFHYLDSSNAEQSETVIMNGTTAVTTSATDITFIQWAHTKSVGSNGVAVGNISIRGLGAGTVFEYVTAGGNQSLSGRYKVPAGKKGYVVGWQASGITKKVDLRLRATVERYDRALIPGIFLFQDILVLDNATSGYIPFYVPLLMPAGAEIKLSAKSGAAGGDAAGQFDIILIDD